MNTKWKRFPKLRTDDNLNNIGEGICRVRHVNNPQAIAKIKGSHDRATGQRWLVIIDGLTVASCGQPGEALKTCEAHLAG